MKELRRRLSRFFYRNNNKGLPNLMLYVAIGNLIVWVFSMADQSNLLYQILRFDPDKILHGQIWRLVSYIFTYLLDAQGLSLITGLISLLCYYFIGNSLEQYWGTLRFNAYYLSGVLIMDLCALLFGCYADTTYLNMSLFLAIATIIPDTKFYLFYIIPVKAKYLAWVDIGLTLISVFSSLLYVFAYGLSLGGLGSALFPLLAILNYILFFGKDIANILPDFLRYRSSKTQREYRAKQIPDPNWSKDYRSSTGEKPYRHKCTVCGRTDVTNPELEFRYCSRCNGFHCYCMDHINNHVHIE